VVHLTCRPIYYLLYYLKYTTYYFRASFSYTLLYTWQCIPIPVSYPGSARARNSVLPSGGKRREESVSVGVSCHLLRVIKALLDYHGYIGVCAYVCVLGFIEEADIGCKSAISTG
jgi:hypothetical protein